MNPLLLLKLLTPRAWFAIGLAAVLAFGAVQTLRIGRLHNDLAQSRQALSNEKAATKRLTVALKLSEDKRAVEYSRAVASAGEAEDACSVRVKAASRSAVRIRSIVERPVPVDARGCAGRAVVSASELRSALQP